MLCLSLQAQHLPHSVAAESLYPSSFWGRGGPSIDYSAAAARYPPRQLQPAPAGQLRHVPREIGAWMRHSACLFGAEGSRVHNQRLQRQRLRVPHGRSAPVSGGSELPRLRGQHDLNVLAEHPHANERSTPPPLPVRVPSTAVQPAPIRLSASSHQPLLQSRYASGG